MEEQHTKRFSGRRMAPILLGTILTVLIISYLGLCIWVGTQNRILPNVSLAGLDVSGMTAEQAQLTLERAMEKYGAKATVTLEYEEWSGTLACSDVQWLTAGLGRLAYDAGRDAFLTQGFQYIRHQFGASTQVNLSQTAIRTEQPALEALLLEAETTIEDAVIQMSYEVDGDQLKVTKGVTGVGFDRERVLFITFHAAETALERAIVGETAVNETVDLAAQNVAVDLAPEQPNFLLLHEELCVEAKNAEMLPGTYEIADHVVGVDFDPSDLAAEYDAAAEGETIFFPLTITQPEETRASFEEKLFRDLLSKATSRVSGSAARKTNVKLSAAACNGVILLPGEEFSYNNTTGSRTEDKGYLPAPSYVGSASVDEVGGGICQTSSTIYYAVLHTTLEVVERANHRYAVGYVPDGMDATVWYGSTDFRFKNNTNYPIKVVTESYDSGGKRYLTVKLYGTNADGRYAVPEKTVYDEVTPTTSYVADETVAQGTLVLDRNQYACTGKKARVYRCIYDANGTLLETQDMGISNYKMRPHLYHYNPLDGNPAAWENGVPPTPITDSTQQPTTDTDSVTNSTAQTETKTDIETGQELSSMTQDPAVETPPTEETPTESQDETAQI